MPDCIRVGVLRHTRWRQIAAQVAAGKLLAVRSNSSTVLRARRYPNDPVLGVPSDSFADAQATAFTDQSLDPGSEVDTAAEHEQLVEAIADRDPAGAVAATLSYLDKSEADLRRHAAQRHSTEQQHHM